MKKRVILNIFDNVHKTYNTMEYLSLFSGIGGFEVGIQKICPNAKCMGYSEINKQAIRIYKANFPGHKNYGDITKINPNEIPFCDLICGGFPCQSFSFAGSRKGFDDTRGNLFFNIVKILKIKKPTFVLLENVKGLIYNNLCRTFKTIIQILDELGYDLQWQVLNSQHFNVPQNRQRIYIVGHLRGTPRPKIFPIFTAGQEVTIQETTGICTATLTAQGAASIGKTGVNAILTQNGYDTQDSHPKIPQPFRRYGVKGNSPSLMTYPNLIETENERVDLSTFIKRKEKKFKETTPTLTSKHIIPEIGIKIDGRIRVLTPIECERLQGFPEIEKHGWTEFGYFEKGEKVWNGEIRINKAKQRVPVMEKAKISGNYLMLDTHRYYALGNAVTVNVVCEVMKRLIKSCPQYNK